MAFYRQNLTEGILYITVHYSMIEPSPLHPNGAAGMEHLLGVSYVLKNYTVSVCLSGYDVSHKMY